MRVEDVRNIAKNLARAEKKKFVEEKLQKLKARLQIEELQMDQSRRMIEVYGKDSAGASRVAEHKAKLCISECIIETINQ